MQTIKNYLEHIGNQISYEIGYFDGSTFWSSRSASSLKEAKEYLKRYEDHYVIVERTTSFRVVENE